MRIGIIGTGMVGQTIAAKLTEVGHQVTIGTRDVAATLARTAPDAWGNPAFSHWQRQHPQVELGTFAAAAAIGEVVVDATAGIAAVEALKIAGEANLSGKILIDVANPLDFSRGMPPTLAVCNTDSLGEQIQRTFPRARVVKTLNTVSAHLMVDPRQLADGDHHVFVSGNDAAAKAQVAEYLRTWFGWRNVIDLGDITTARGTEMLLPMWLSLWGVLGSPTINLKVIR